MNATSAIELTQGDAVMRKVIVYELLSLDGVAEATDAGPPGRLSVRLSLGGLPGRELKPR